MAGFVKTFREILDWEWYQDGNTFRLFMHLLLKANYKAGKYQGYDILPGQVVTGRKALAEQLKLSEQQIRTSLNKLEKSAEITIKKTNKFSIITITKWDEYQGDNQQTTNKQPTDNQQITTSKEGKKGRKKEEGKITSLQGLRESNLNGSIEAWFKEKAPNVDRFRLRDKLVAYCESQNKSYKNYTGALRSWGLRDQEQFEKKNPKKQQKNLEEQMDEFQF